MMVIGQITPVLRDWRSIGEGIGAETVQLEFIGSQILLPADGSKLLVRRMWDLPTPGSPEGRLVTERPKVFYPSTVPIVFEDPIPQLFKENLWVFGFYFVYKSLRRNRATFDYQVKLTQLNDFN